VQVWELAFHQTHQHPTFLIFSERVSLHYLELVIMKKKTLKPAQQSSKEK